MQRQEDHEEAPPDLTLIGTKLTSAELHFTSQEARLFLSHVHHEYQFVVDSTVISDPTRAAGISIPFGSIYCLLGI